MTLKFQFEIFLLWLILVTFGYKFHLAQLFPFPASARTSKSAHSFASYRLANQTHLGVSLWEINPVLLWSVCHFKVSLLTNHSCIFKKSIFYIKSNFQLNTDTLTIKIWLPCQSNKVPIGPILDQKIHFHRSKPHFPLKPIKPKYVKT